MNFGTPELRSETSLECASVSFHLCLSLDPHADTGALTPSADWVKCCFY